MLDQNGARDGFEEPRICIAHDNRGKRTEYAPLAPPVASTSSAQESAAEPDKDEPAKDSGTEDSSTKD